jgi:hypothetical protein
MNSNGNESGAFDRLVESAEAGRLEKAELASLLNSDARPVFLEACSAIERRLQDECAASGDPCLEDGCAMDGEACLQAVLKAGPEYQKACGAAWIKLFRDPHNRHENWSA